MWKVYESGDDSIYHTHVTARDQCAKIDSSYEVTIRSFLRLRLIIQTSFYAQQCLK